MIDLGWPLRHHLDIFSGTQRFANEDGHWECVVDPFADERLGTIRGNSEYDGVIARATRKLTNRAKRVDVPIVNVWVNSPVRNVPSVLTDGATAGKMAAEHLMARGLRQFGFVGYARDRMSGLMGNAFQATVAANGFPCTRYETVRVMDSVRAWNSFQGNIAHWIENWSFPIGICMQHDIMARYLTSACLRKQVRVPDDVAIISSPNELMICQHPEPSLTSVDLNYEEVGYQAAALLDRLMDHAKPPLKPRLVAPRELIARQSTDVYSVSDPLVSQAMRFISEHGGEHIKVSDVAAHVHVTRRTLERRFQRTVGRPISGEIQRLRVERVKRQLLESDAPIKMIATRLGYCNSKRLCEAFRRREGITPGDYRRQIRGAK